jgi:hypothetical protein
VEVTETGGSTHAGKSHSSMLRKVDGDGYSDKMLMSSSSETSSSSEKESIAASNHHTSLALSRETGKKGSTSVENCNPLGWSVGTGVVHDRAGEVGLKAFPWLRSQPRHKNRRPDIKTKKLEWKLKKWNLKNQILL